MAKIRPETVITDLRDLRALGRRYRVRLMCYRRGAVPVAEDLAGSYGSINSALVEADRLQSELDDRCEPVQAYVIDDHNVPVGRAGGRP